jgi:hypothetical protein
MPDSNEPYTTASLGPAAMAASSSSLHLNGLAEAGGIAGVELRWLAKRSVEQGDGCRDASGRGILQAGTNPSQWHLARTLGRGHTHPVRQGLFVPTRLMGKPVAQALFIRLLRTRESGVRDCGRE